MTVHGEGVGDRHCNKSEKSENVVRWGGGVQLQGKLTLELILRDRAGKEGQKSVFYRNGYGQELFTCLLYARQSA